MRKPATCHVLVFDKALSPSHPPTPTTSSFSSIFPRSFSPPLLIRRVSVLAGAIRVGDRPSSSLPIPASSIFVGIMEETCRGYLARSIGYVVVSIPAYPPRLFRFFFSSLFFFYSVRSCLFFNLFRLRIRLFQIRHEITRDQVCARSISDYDRP